MNINEFSNLCRKYLSRSIESLGFLESRVLSRTRGYLFEYQLKKTRILISLEDSELVFDLIIPSSNNQWVRVSYNQMLWYEGDYTFKRAETIVGKFEILKSNINLFLDMFMNKILTNFDHRYCYKMTDSELKIYIDSQQ